MSALAILAFSAAGNLALEGRLRVAIPCLVLLRRAGLTSFYSTQYDVMGYGALGWTLRGFGIGALYLNSPAIPRAGEESLIRAGYR